MQVINLIAQGTIEHGMLETLSMKQGLADGVIDGIGDFAEIKLKRGGQSFLSRLEHTLELGKQHAVPTRRPALAPSDPGLTLAGAMREACGDHLVHAEEHFICEGGISKVYLVVDRKTPAVEKSLSVACARCYPDQHELPDWIVENVILVDAATHQSILQLQRAGLMQTNTRARRNLLDPGEATETKPVLSAAQLAEIEALSKKRDEQLKAAKVLRESGLPALIGNHLLGAFHATAGIASIRCFTTPPATFAEVAEEPHRSHLPGALQPWIARLETLGDCGDTEVLDELAELLRSAD